MPTRGPAAALGREGLSWTKVEALRRSYVSRAGATRAGWACQVLSPLPAVAPVLAHADGVVPGRAARWVLSLRFIGSNLAHMPATWLDHRIWRAPRAPAAVLA